MSYTADQLIGAKRCIFVYDKHKRWSECQIYDLNGDGRVDGKDIAIIAKNMQPAEVAAFQFMEFTEKNKGLLIIGGLLLLLVIGIAFFRR